MWIVRALPTDHQTHRPTDTASYRCALAHKRILYLLGSSTNHPFAVGNQKEDEKENRRESEQTGDDQFFQMILGKVEEDSEHVSEEGRKRLHFNAI